MNDVSQSCNLRFEIASQWPWAREAMRQHLYYQYQLGIIDAKRLKELLPTPTSTRIYESDMDTKMNAESENVMLLSGERFDPLPTDDHDGHLHYHTMAINLPEKRHEYLKSREQLAPLLEHMQKHFQSKAPPAPPPPAAKLNISARDIVMDPEGRNLIMGIVRQAVGQPSIPSAPQAQAEGARAPNQQDAGPPSLGVPGLGTPQPPESMGPHGVPMGPEIPGDSFV
jgi:hypothetical protein